MLLFHEQTIPRHNQPVLYNNESSTETAQSETTDFSFLNLKRPVYTLSEHVRENKEKCLENQKAWYKCWPLLSVLDIITSKFPRDFVFVGTEKVVFLDPGLHVAKVSVLFPTD